MASKRDIAFHVLALGSGLAAAFHVLGLAGLLSGNTTPMWRHALFIPINIALVWYLIRRPAWGLPLFAMLVAQQSWGHGGRLRSVWRETGAIEPIHIVTIVGLWLALFLLILDWRSRRTRPL